MCETDRRETADRNHGGKPPAHRTTWTVDGLTRRADLNGLQEI